MMMCLLIVAICSGQGIAKEPPQPVTIQLNWMPTVQFAGILLAKERGWYEEAGIDLTVKAYEWGMVTIDEVVSGKAQIGLAEGDDLIRGKARDSNVKAIAVQLQKSPFCLMSKKDREIEKPEQLVGKKVGVSDPASVIMTKLVLASADLSYDKDITPIDSKWDIRKLVRNEIDVYVGFMNDEPLTMKEKGYETNVIPAFKYGYDFYSGVYFVTDTMIRKQPDMVRKFLDATLRGWKEAFRDPAGTAKLIVEKCYPQGSVSQQTESLKVFKLLATIGVGESLIGYMERPFWQEGIDILYKFKQIDRKIPAEDVFTLEFLKAKLK